MLLSAAREMTCHSFNDMVQKYVTNYVLGSMTYVLGELSVQAMNSEFKKIDRTKYTCGAIVSSHSNLWSWRSQQTSHVFAAHRSSHERRACTTVINLKYATPNCAFQTFTKTPVAALSLLCSGISHLRCHSPHLENVNNLCSSSKRPI